MTKYVIFWISKNGMEGDVSGYFRSPERAADECEKYNDEWMPEIEYFVGLVV